MLSLVEPPPASYEAEERAAIQGIPPPHARLLRFLSPDDLCAPVRPTPYVVRGLEIAPGPPTVFVGNGYGGKTLCAQAAAMSILAGKCVWEQFDAKHGVVVHLDHEQGRDLTVRRYQRLAVGAGVAMRDVAHSLRASILPSLNLTDGEAEDEYSWACEGAALMFLDSLRAAAPGVDENDSRFGDLLQRLFRVSERTGCSIVVIHHAGKPKEGKREAQHAGRGSSALFDRAQSWLYFNSEKDGDGNTVIRVEHAKARISGQLAEPFYLRIEDVAAPADPADRSSPWDPRAGLRVRYLTEQQVRPPEQSAGAQVRDAVLAYLRSETLAGRGVAGKDALAEAVHKNRAAVGSAVDALAEAGEIESRHVVTPHGKRPRLFAVMGDVD